MLMSIALKFADKIEKEIQDTGQVDIYNFVNAHIMKGLCENPFLFNLIFSGLSMDEASHIVVEDTIDILKDLPQYEYIKNKKIIKKRLEKLV